MNVWHHRRTANHNTEQVWLTSREIQNSFVKGWEIKVYDEFKRISTEVLVHERRHIKEIIMLYHEWNLLYIVDHI